MRAMLRPSGNTLAHQIVLTLLIGVSLSVPRHLFGQTLLQPGKELFPTWSVAEPNQVSEPDADRIAARPDASQVAPFLARHVDPIVASRETQATTMVDQPASSDLDWLSSTRVGYDSGFVIASNQQQDLQAGDFPYSLRINGWGQIRHTILDSDGSNLDINQFQLKRARITFAGSAFTPEFAYFLQLDGRSSSGDDMRLLDYFLTYDFGRHLLDCDAHTIGFKAGKYKIPFTMARYLSGREFEFTDRAMSSMYFDVNRSLAWGLYGEAQTWRTPINWEIAIFNGLVTGGAETGSSGNLDTNFAFSARMFSFPTGEWGKGSLADLDGHQRLATRAGAGFANSKIDRSGSSEFNRVRVVDSGATLGSILPGAIDAYDVNIYSVDLSTKFRGWSSTIEYYFRTIDGYEGAMLPSLFDHGFWLQLGKFIVPSKVQLLSRWSRVDGNSGTLGATDQSAEEIAGGLVWYFRDQHAKLTIDVTHLDGAPISSASLDIAPGDIGWLFRSQIQFAF